VRLGTRRRARMPAANTATRKRPLPAAVRGALRPRPDLRVVPGAAGAPDTGRALSAVLPGGQEGRDVSPAPLGAALGAVSGEGTSKDQARCETWRAVRRDAPEGG
jgi:hypothetical protein